MEDQEENLPSDPPGFEPLFINEEDGEKENAFITESVEFSTMQSGIKFTGTCLNPSVHIQPYLREMDEILKSCEDLTGLAFGSRFSSSFTDLCGVTQGQLEGEVSVDRFEKTTISPQTYLSTSYIDTRMDGAETQNHETHVQQHGMSSIMDRFGAATGVSSRLDMPLTTAGNELCSSMEEYQSHLMGMLAVLDGCLDEQGMDFDPYKWDIDTNQEYVQVSQNHSHSRTTTLGSVDGWSAGRLATHPAVQQSWDVKETRGQESMESTGEGMLGSSIETSSIKEWVSQENAKDVSGERQEMAVSETGFCVDYKVDLNALKAQLRSSGSPIPTERCSQDFGNNDKTNTGQLATYDESCTKKDTSGMDVEETGLPADGPPEQEQEQEEAEPGGYEEELRAVGSKMEECIEKVQHLEKKRVELLEEVLELRGEKDGWGEGEGDGEETSEQKVAKLMKILKKEAEGRKEERQKDVHSLREERAKEEKRVWTINLERQSLQEEAWKLRRRLFTTARECAQNQATLTIQHQELEQFMTVKEQLESLEAKLTEELSQLQSTHQQHISSLQDQLKAQRTSQKTCTQEELYQSRRRSCEDVQQFLQDGLKALEDRFEPMLLTLLKRKDAVTAALTKAKEQVQELRVQLGPLRDERQKLGLQRKCLEEKLNLKQIQRREDMEHYKELVYRLEETSRELKTELKIQKKKTEEMAEHNDSLTRQLILYKGATEDHSKCDHKEEKT